MWLFRRCVGEQSWCREGREGEEREGGRERETEMEGEAGRRREREEKRVREEERGTEGDGREGERGRMLKLCAHALLARLIV